MNSKISRHYSEVYRLTWSDNKVPELIAVKVLHTSLLNIIVVAFKALPLRSYAPIPAPSPDFKTILELVLWNDLQSCRRVTPDVINVIKMPSFQYLILSFGTEESHLGLHPVNREGVPAQLSVY
jgi:hypothetical protein